MSRSMGKHAVVIGSSMAGVLAAHVLSEHFDRVTVVERDGLPDNADFRKGVPQARHPHALLAKGRQIIEEMFPGITEQMIAEGAIEVEWPADQLQHGSSGWEYRGERGQGLMTISATRPLMDWVIRRNVYANDRITALTRREAIGLISDDGGNSVAGVVLRARGENSGEREELRADLVIDACGRDSKAPKWLTDIGSQAPEESVVNPFQGYATAVFRREPGLIDDWKILVYLPYPESPRGAVMIPVEGDRWIATVTGFGRDYPPTELDGYLEFAKKLPGGVLYDVVKDAELLSPINGYRNMANVKRHYESLRSQPERFLVVGDAACAFNPVYAQGLTVAALGIVTLRETLARFAEQGTMSGLARKFQRKLAKTNSVPWQLATEQDLTFSATEGGKLGLLSKLTSPYIKRLMRASATGAPAALEVNKVMHMVAPPTTFFSLKMIKAALRPGPGGRSEPPIAAQSRATVADVETGSAGT